MFDLTKNVIVQKNTLVRKMAVLKCALEITAQAVQEIPLN